MRPPEHVGIVHDLSEPGARPLCGAEPTPETSRTSAQPVNCAACLRLLADDERRFAHAARPRVHDSED